MARADKGVSAGALMTTVQPAARAGAILRVIMALGKFLYNNGAMSNWNLGSKGSVPHQGVIKPHTPTGCLITVLRVPG